MKHDFKSPGFVSVYPNLFQNTPKCPHLER